MNVRRLGDVRCALGEGPYWDAREQVLYFVDIGESTIWRYDPSDESFRSWSTPAPPAAISRTTNDQFIAVLEDGFYLFDPLEGTFATLARPSIDLSNTHLNDAKVDRQGRFVAGAMDNQKDRPIADVVSFDGKSVQHVDSGMHISNGPCWNPDGSVFYLADTIAKAIYCYDYDVETGAASNRRVFADVSGLGGLADGATVDVDGRLWSAFVRQGDIICFRPDGTIESVLETGIDWITSIQFGGPRLDQMYVTSLQPRGFEMNSVAGAGYLYLVDGHNAVGIAEPLALDPVPV